MPRTSSLWNRGDASFSRCGRFRFSLTRDFAAPLMPPEDFPEAAGRRVAWIGLNPSTADALQDDPTVRRCIRFALSWGFSGITMLNACPFRSTDPAGLMRAGFDGGQRENRETIVRQCTTDRPLVIAAWGSTFTREPAFRAAADWILKRLFMLGVQVHSMGETLSGDPVHPLYLHGRTRPRPYLRIPE